MKSDYWGPVTTRNMTTWRPRRFSQPRPQRPREIQNGGRRRPWYILWHGTFGFRLRYTFFGIKYGKKQFGNSHRVFSLLLQFRFSLPRIGKDFFWHLPLDLVSPKRVKKEKVGPSSERRATTVETTALEPLYGGQITLSTRSVAKF